MGRNLRLNQQSVTIIGSPQEKHGLGKARNYSHTPLMKGSESARNVMARRGTSIGITGSKGNILSNDSSQPSTNISPTKFGTRRHSELPRLGNRAIGNRQQSQVSTQIDSIEEQ